MSRGIAVLVYTYTNTWFPFDIFEEVLFASYKVWMVELHVVRLTFDSSCV